MTSLTQALPLTQGIDNQVCFLIVNYMVAYNTWTSQVFSSAQYAYNKDDLSSTQRPSVMCTPIWSEKDSFGYSQIGHVLLELHFSLQEQRINLAQNVIQIANLLQLINLNQSFTQYAQQYMSGLFWIGKYCKSDYSKVYAKESVVTLTLDYKIDLLAYQNELQTQGFDITSPDEQIYLAVQNMNLTTLVLGQESNLQDYWILGTENNSNLSSTTIIAPANEANNFIKA